MDRLRHIADASRELLSLKDQFDRSDLDRERFIMLSMVKLIEIIGEAASKTTDEFRDRHPQIPWRSMIRARNRLIHGYFDLDMDVIWNTVIESIPPLLKEVEIILANEDQ